MLLRCAHCRTPIELSDDETAFNQCPTCASSLTRVAVRADDFSPGDRISHFELAEKLGEGSYGAVWKAKDTDLDRWVAIKLPRRESVDEDRLLREAKAAASVPHPSIIEVFEICLDGDRPYIVTEFVDGTTLEEWLHEHEPSPAEVAAMVKRLAAAMHVAHGATVVHRDIKPTNILVDREGGLHIADFGIAKREDADATMTIDGQILGTPAYMPPEQARGEKADRQADIYSLGAVLYRMLSGQAPFSGSAHAIMARVLSDELPELDKSVPEELRAICSKAMSKVRTDRYETADDMASDLQRFLDGERVVAKAPPLRKSTSGKKLLVVGLLAVVAAGLYFGLRGAVAEDDETPQPSSLMMPVAEEPTVIIPTKGITDLYVMPVFGYTCLHDPTKGDSHRKTNIKSDEVALKLRAGTRYLIVAASAGEAQFHEVWRQVPSTGMEPGRFRHNSWTWREDGAVRLPEITLFASTDVREKQSMRLVSGGRAAVGHDDPRIVGKAKYVFSGKNAAYTPWLNPYSLGAAEVSVSDFEKWRRSERLPDQEVGHLSNAPVTGADPDGIVAYLESVGARLPTDEEWEFIALAIADGNAYPTAFGASCYPIEGMEQGRVPNGKTPDQSPNGIEYLLTGPAEVTCSAKLDRGMLLNRADMDRGILFGIRYKGPNWAVRGFRTEYVHGKQAEETAGKQKAVSLISDRATMSAPQYWIGFRAARSEFPRWNWEQIDFDIPEKCRRALDE